MSHARLSIVLATLFFIPSLAPAMGADAGYVLGPDDELAIRVYDFRPKSGEAFAWQALTGDFTVGADGNVSMPILGPLRAEGSDATEFAGRLSESLKDKVGLTELPAASVEVKRHRPFFVVGAVHRPGMFEFQPGMDVLQAVGTAEGLGGAADLDAARREVVAARGEVRELAAERVGLLATQGRLAAEIDGGDAPVFPPDLIARAQDPRVARAMREETLLFDTERSGLNAELATIEQSRVVLRQEISSLAQKGKSLDHQIDVNKKQLAVVTDLLNKGMTDKPRQIAAEQAEASFESSRLDVDIASLKAQQDLSRADRDTVELKARFRRQALDRAAETRSRLDQNEEKSHTAETALRDAEARAPGGGEDDPIPSYELVRRGPSGPVTLAARESDPMQAGDVLRVTVRRPDAVARNAAGGGPPARAAQALSTETAVAPAQTQVYASPPAAPQGQPAGARPRVRAPVLDSSAR